MTRHFGWNAFSFGFGPRGFWGGPRAGGRRRQWFESGDMKYVILKLLKDKPRHGYEVMKELDGERDRPVGVVGHRERQRHLPTATFRSARAECRIRTPESLICAMPPSSAVCWPS